MRQDLPGPTANAVMPAVLTARCSTHRIAAPWPTTATVLPGWSAAMAKRADSILAMTSKSISTPASGGKGACSFQACHARGCLARTSAAVQPCSTPNSRSFRRSSTQRLMPAAAAMYWPVCRALTSGELHTAARSLARRASARCWACSRPASFKGMSITPWNFFSRFQSVAPCRQKRMVVGAAGCSASFACNRIFPPALPRRP
mmetsp:Transcript_13431/g.42227  ORF Transcript_13431/g.42227 Transcript_13431/m.42227 type:complete len:203 (+) Transcript_13431:810-1418(+)